MERSEGGEKEETPSQQNNMWKQFQAKAKPLLSPKLGTRESDDKKERGMWLFKKKTRHTVLDRVISSSQPDLLFSSSSSVDSDGKAARRCSKADSRDKLQSSKRRSVSPSKPTVAQLVQSHHKSSSLGSACLERLVEPPDCSDGETAAAAAAEAQLEGKDEQPGRDSPGSSGANPDRALPGSGMYKLEMDLKRGRNLAIRDRGGTSDPYVKMKLNGKEVFRSKTIHKNLNPVWDERTTLIVDSLSEPLYVKVFDYDFGLHDDFMGSAYLHLESLEQQRTIPVTLVLKDRRYPDQDLGTLELAVTLTPKDSPIEELRDPTRKEVKAYRWKPYVNKVSPLVLSLRGSFP